MERRTSTPKRWGQDPRRGSGWVPDRPLEDLPLQRAGEPKLPSFPLPQALQPIGDRSQTDESRSRKAFAPLGNRLGMDREPQAAGGATTSSYAWRLVMSPACWKMSESGTLLTQWTVSDTLRFRQIIRDVAKFSKLSLEKGTPKEGTPPNHQCHG